MRKLLLLVALLSSTSFAQSATRPIVFTFTPSASAQVTGYNVYQCTVTTGTSCTPSTTGTPVATGTSSPMVYNAVIGSVYSFALVAVAPACTPSTPVTSTCGNSAAVIVTTSVPLQTPPASGATPSVP